MDQELDSLDEKLQPMVSHLKPLNQSHNVNILEKQADIISPKSNLGDIQSESDDFQTASMGSADYLDMQLDLESTDDYVECETGSAELEVKLEAKSGKLQIIPKDQSTDFNSQDIHCENAEIEFSNQKTEIEDPPIIFILEKRFEIDDLEFSDQEIESVSPRNKPNLIPKFEEIQTKFLNVEAEPNLLLQPNKAQLENSTMELKYERAPEFAKIRKSEVPPKFVKLTVEFEKNQTELSVDSEEAQTELDVESEKAHVEYEQLKMEAVDACSEYRYEECQSNSSIFDAEAKNKILEERVKCLRNQMNQLKKNINVEKEFLRKEKEDLKNMNAVQAIELFDCGEELINESHYCCMCYNEEYNNTGTSHVCSCKSGSSTSHLGSELTFYTSEQALYSPEPTLNDLSLLDYDTKLSYYESSLSQVTAEKRLKFKKQIMANAYYQRLMDVESMCKLELFKMQKIVEKIEPLQTKLSDLDEKEEYQHWDDELIGRSSVSMKDSKKEASVEIDFEQSLTLNVKNMPCTCGASSKSSSSVEDKDEEQEIKENEQEQNDEEKNEKDWNDEQEQKDDDKKEEKDDNDEQEEKVNKQESNDNEGDDEQEQENDEETERDDEKEMTLL